ncbi:hypothetical protein M2459_003482 [Parabacteroides sp. PF5-5]|uniref:hypothetical protein n=1 Tax=unclassified Parabacteroides TaxID=2649774 RepID=UPI002476F364|nr:MULTISPECIES: hypothetical protein [unclassified Parabacteroides]MDH6306891.1 hypothetical protein [Parabacteroides sp. PH5-39]MDH6317721.1 hypothetical protein [Parabacteroides sp. PF5-13]MDH6321593.1 hypothetical protein [Parabacteroides sp. PH5-13]MDH6325278.1 hypothetical protein [Parabacteroides sp. PH5-8]MDH6328906.1 hypothetical protein [Parabacteroides sp. PH5-41]
MKTWTILISLLLLISCTSETNIDPPGPEEGGDKNLTLKVLIPGTETPESYALTESQENAISTIDVLVFKKGVPDTQGNEIFLQRATATTINGTGREKTFTITLAKQSETVRLVILANATTLINGLTLTEGTTSKQYLIDNLIFNAESFKPTTPVTGFPMWGQSATLVDLSSSSTTQVPDIYLLRATAGVDVIKSASLSNDKFEINKVYVYNAKQKGFIAPSGSLTIDDNTKVTSPNIPTTGQGNFNFNLPYVSGGIIREMYIGENSAKSASNTTPTYIVLEAKYNKGAYTYYRLDFVKDGNYISVLRNYKYVFNILSVQGDGFTTIQEAEDADAPSSGIVSELTIDSENNAPIHNIVYNNQHMLGVSIAEVLFDWNMPWIGKTSTDANNYYDIRVLTTYGNGNDWIAAKASSWFNIQKVDKNTLRISMVGNNLTGSERSGLVTIKAGDLTMTVNVRQSGGANSYMVRFKNNTATTKIPLSFAKVASGSDLDGIDPNSLRTKILWKEVTVGTPVDFKAEIKGTGNASNRYIEVTATSNGSYYGNAVVALFVGNGIGMVGGSSSETILWSWHIWSMPESVDTDIRFHDPNTNKFMYTVLGKHSNNNGLFYQWGRKDPFPRSYTNVSPHVIKITEVSDLNTIDYVIQRPTTFFHNTTENRYNSSWLATPNAPERDYWKTDIKTHYDPCPTGWRVPIRSDQDEWTLNPPTVSELENGRLSHLNGNWEQSGPGYKGFLWYVTSPESGSNYPVWLVESDGSIGRAAGSASSTMGNSVRCIKDIELVKGL